MNVDKKNRGKVKLSIVSMKRFTAAGEDGGLTEAVQKKNKLLSASATIGRSQ